MITISKAMLKMNKLIKDTKVFYISVGSTIDMADMEVEVDSLGIATTDHVNPSSVSHAIKKVTDMQTAHTRTELT